MLKKKKKERSLVGLQWVGVLTVGEEEVGSLLSPLTWEPAAQALPVGVWL